MKVCAPSLWYGVMFEHLLTSGNFNATLNFALLHFRDNIVLFSTPVIPYYWLLII